MYERKLLTHIYSWDDVLDLLDVEWHCEIEQLPADIVLARANHAEKVSDKLLHIVNELKFARRVNRTMIREGYYDRKHFYYFETYDEKYGDIKFIHLDDGKTERFLISVHDLKKLRYGKEHHKWDGKLSQIEYKDLYEHEELAYLLSVPYMEDIYRIEDDGDVFGNYETDETSRIVIVKSMVKSAELIFSSLKTYEKEWWADSNNFHEIRPCKIDIYEVENRFGKFRIVKARGQQICTEYYLPIKISKQVFS